MSGQLAALVNAMTDVRAKLENQDATIVQQGVTIAKQGATIAKQGATIAKQLATIEDLQVRNSTQDQVIGSLQVKNKMQEAMNDAQDRAIKMLQLDLHAEREARKDDIESLVQVSPILFPDLFCVNS